MDDTEDTKPASQGIETQVYSPYNLYNIISTVMLILQYLCIQIWFTYLIDDNL